MVPSNHIVYSRTWSHAVEAHRGTPGGIIYIDGVELHNASNVSDWGIWEGHITPTQLFPDVFHEISVFNYEGLHGGSSENGTSYVGIVLIYSEPPE